MLKKQFWDFPPAIDGKRIELQFMFASAAEKFKLIEQDTVAVIVEYERIPYVYRMQDANVRVTFDRNILSGSDVRAFLDERIAGRGILPVGTELMEVKFDSFLPDEIYQILQLEGLRASTFSKYYLCRKFQVRQKR